MSKKQTNKEISELNTEIESVESVESVESDIEIAPNTVLSEEECAAMIANMVIKAKRSKEKKAVAKSYHFDPKTRKFHYVAYCVIDMLMTGPLSLNQVTCELAKRGQTNGINFAKATSSLEELVDIAMVVNTDGKYSLVTSPELSLDATLELYNLAWTNEMRKRTGREHVAPEAIFQGK